MKLQDLDIIVTAPPAPGWGGRYWILVKLTTDTGIAASVGPVAMRAVIEDVFARHMQGENPENIELMFRRAYSSGFTARPDLTVMGAFSGLEIACWDILGKARERPVWALLGGRVNDRIRAYTYLYPLPITIRISGSRPIRPPKPPPIAWHVVIPPSSSTPPVPIRSMAATCPR